MNEEWSKEHKDHGTRLIRAESLGVSENDYPYVWLYFCDTCGWFDPYGNPVKITFNENFEKEYMTKKLKENLPKCSSCGGNTTYDGYRGSAVCLTCLKDYVLPLDFLDQITKS